MTGELVTAFGLERVIVNSQQQVMQAFVALAQQEDLHDGVSAVLQEDGVPMSVRLKRHFEDPDEIARLTNIFRGHMGRIGYGPTRLMPGARAAISEALGKGRAAILSGRPQTDAADLCRYHGIERIHIRGDVYGRKAEVLRELGAHVYVAANTDDMTAAREAGVDLRLGVLTGLSSTKELLEAGAGGVIRSLEYFPGVLQAYAPVADTW